jgi:hypothetical protein
VPTYRRPALLRRALRSVTSQAAPAFDLSVVVYDNASGDETAAVARAADTIPVPVRYVCAPENIGVIGNFRQAIRDVRTDFFTIISDDDVLLPGALAANLAQLLAQPSAMAWNGYVPSATPVSLVAVRPAPQWPLGLTGPEEALDLISRNIRPETTGMVFRREVIDEQFMLDDDQVLAIDLFWLCGAARHGGIGLSSHAAAILYMHEQSVSSSSDTGRAVDVLFPSIPRLCESLEGWELPARVRARVIAQLQQTYGEQGLMLLLYRAALRGDRAGIDVVERTAGQYRWLAAVRAAVPWAQHASPVALRAALLLRQLRYGNRRQKLATLAWGWRYRARYRRYLQQ